MGKKTAKRKKTKKKTAAQLRDTKLRKPKEKKKKKKRETVKPLYQNPNKEKTSADRIALAKLDKDIRAAGAALMPRSPRSAQRWKSCSSATTSTL